MHVLHLGSAEVRREPVNPRHGVHLFGQMDLQVPQNVAPLLDVRREALQVEEFGQAGVLVRDVRPQR